MGGNPKGTCLLMSSLVDDEPFIEMGKAARRQGWVRRKENPSSLSFQDPALSCFSPIL